MYEYIAPFQSVFWAKGAYGLNNALLQSLC